MAKKETHYHLHQFLEEIRQTEGLPENLSTEAQLWDEIFRKEAYIMSEQLFPLIKEIHGKSYSVGTSIKPLATEFSVERSESKKITSIRADITVIVNEQDIYHFECQIENDGTMVLRMFEYDVHMALSYPKTEEKSEEGSRNPKKICLQFPHSAVLYLQDNQNTPDKLSCQIKFQDGGIYEYEVPALKVQAYSLEEIKEKHLCVLIPFLPLRFRKHMRYDKKTKKTWFLLAKEELTSFYQQLILILDEEVAQGYLSENNRSVILSLLSKSLIRVFYRDDTLIKEVIHMTEPILELEIEKYMKRSEESFQRYEQAFQQYEQATQMYEQTSQELEQTTQMYEQTSQELEQTTQMYEQTSQELEQTTQMYEQTSQELEQTTQMYEQTSQKLEQTTQELERYKKQNSEKEKVISTMQEQIAALQEQVSLLMQNLPAK